MDRVDVFKTDGKVLAKFTSCKDQAEPFNRTIAQHHMDVARAVDVMIRLRVAPYRLLLAEGIDPNDIRTIMIAAALIHDFGKASMEFCIMRRAAENYKNSREAFGDRKDEFWDVLFRRHEYYGVLLARLLSQTKMLDIPLDPNPEVNRVLNDILLPYIVGSHHHVMRDNDAYWQKMRGVEVSDEFVFFGGMGKGKKRIRDEGTDDIHKPGHFAATLDRIQEQFLTHLGVEIDFRELLKQIPSSETRDMYSLCYQWLIGRVRGWQNNTLRAHDHTPTALDDAHWLHLTQIFKGFVSLFRYADGWASSREPLVDKVHQFLPPHSLKNSGMGVLKRLVGDSYVPRWWQSQALKNHLDHLIISAECGSGKTMVGLAAGFANKKGRPKVFLLLPTTTACDAFYEKIKRGDFDHLSPGLRHSRAFRKIRDLVVRQADVDEHSDWQKTMASHETFISKRLLKPINICTMDQACLAALGSPNGCHVTENNVEDTTFILDEIDGYSPFELSYLEHLITQMHRCRFILLSGSMPTNLRDFFANKLRNPRGEKGTRNVTLISDVGERPDKPRFEVEYRPDLSLFTQVSSIVAAGRKAPVLVRCTTVGTAQAIFARLRRRKDCPAHLLHSNFATTDRTEHESQIIELVQAGKPCIVIGTSIIDRCLDLDFHEVWAEVCPINDLIQIGGRLNRFRYRSEAVMHVVARTSNGQIADRDGAPFYKPYPKRCIELTIMLLDANGRTFSDKQLDELNDKYFMGWKTDEGFERGWCPDLVEHMDYKTARGRLYDVVWWGQEGNETFQVAGILAYPHMQRLHKRKGMRSMTIREAVGRYGVRKGLDNEANVFVRYYMNQILELAKMEDDDMVYEYLEQYRTSLLFYQILGLREAHNRGIRSTNGQPLIEPVALANGGEIEVFALPYDSEIGVNRQTLDIFLKRVGNGG